MGPPPKKPSGIAFTPPHNIIGPSFALLLRYTIGRGIGRILVAYTTILSYNCPAE
jgi:hypothetical protein